MVDQRARADHERRAAVLLAPGERELQRGPGGDDLGERGLEAEPPQLAHELLGRVVGVVGQEDDPLVRLAQGGQRRRRAVRGLVADPQTPVEIDQEMVVATGDGGERHAGLIIIGPDVQAPHAGRAAARVRADPLRLRRRREGDSPPPRRPRPRRPSPPRRRAARRSPSPSRRNEAKLPKPTTELKAGKTYVARVLTNCGEFEITLDPKRAPKTGGSFASLVGKRFYDGLTFHRIVAGFVIQGGDPAGDGSGGPGYTVVEAPPEDLTYSKGVVAMAKTAHRPGRRVGQPVLRRHRRGRRPAAGVRAARQGHQGPGGRRQDRRRSPSGPTRRRPSPW